MVKLVFLLPFTVLSILISGCIVGMPIEETLQEANLAPVLRFQTGKIVDPNGEDRLFWKWFINYEPNTGRGLVEEGPGDGLPPENWGAEGITINIQPCSNGNLLDSPTNIHRIELVVTDRPFRGNSSRTDPNARPFQEIADNATSIKLIWYLQFDDTDCP